MDKLGEHTKDLPPLPVGCSVLIQNQLGNHPKRWEKRGTVVEALPHRQYKVRVDGSRRLTLRNRQFLKQYQPLVVEDRPKPVISKPQKEKPYVAPDASLLRAQSQLNLGETTPLPHQPQEIPYLVPAENEISISPHTPVSQNMLAPRTPHTVSCAQSPPLPDPNWI